LVRTVTNILSYLYGRYQVYARIEHGIVSCHNISHLLGRYNSTVSRTVAYDVFGGFVLLPIMLDVVVRGASVNAVTTRQ